MRDSFLGVTVHVHHKGESAQQMATNNQVAQQQLALQQQEVSQYNSYIQQLISGGGYLPGVKSALTSQAIQSVPQQYNQIAQQLATSAGSRGISGGGSQPGSGLLTQGLGQLYSAEEQQKSNLLNQITAQGQQNIAQGEGGVLNIAGLGTQGGTSALQSATSAANSANQQSGLLGTIIGGGLGVLGSALGKGGALAGCWIAGELYGWYSPEMLVIRDWIFGTWYMKPFAWLYLKFGERWAEWIKQNSVLRKATKLLFDRFLRIANVY